MSSTAIRYTMLLRMTAAQGEERPDRFKYCPPRYAEVGVSGRYLKQWEADWLGQVIAKIDAAPTRRPGRIGGSNVQPRRLDRRLSPNTIAEVVDAYRSGTSHQSAV
ncbi:hypothetical protein [Nocardia sp. CA-120079]|uniref:hypothetical protein n=1 Tax=Nocardia sp. CA-120079 TaxID=3239974 RepID=UPI003D98DED2